MFKVNEDHHLLEISDHMPRGRRLLFLLLALIPLLAPYELIIRPNWDSFFNVFFLFALMISAGAIAVSAFLAWAAIAGLNSRMRFDKPLKSFTYWVEAPIIPVRKHEFPIEAIHQLDIEVHEWSEGQPSFSFKLTMQNGEVFTTASSWSRNEIETIKNRVASFLAEMSNST
jgi:hypothetical protein